MIAGPLTMMEVHSAKRRIRTGCRCVETSMSAAFRGSEAVAAGRVTRGELAGRSFDRVGHDLYVPVGTVLDHRARVDVAAIRGGPSTVVTGWSATVVWGLDVLPHREPPVETAVPDRRPRSERACLVRRQGFASGEVVVHEELVVTTPLRTAFDLATRSGTTDAVVAADALGRLDHFGGNDLAAFADPHPGARGVRRVAAVATLMDPRSESPPETRVRLALVRGGLPAPAVQYQVVDEHRVARVDMAWATYRVALEYDGHDHALADRRGKDIDRIEDLRSLGWVVIVVTKRQAQNPEWIVRRVRSALVERGWR